MGRPTATRATATHNQVPRLLGLLLEPEVKAANRCRHTKVRFVPRLLEVVPCLESD